MNRILKQFKEIPFDKRNLDIANKFYGVLEKYLDLKTPSYERKPDSIIRSILRLNHEIHYDQAELVRDVADEIVNWNHSFGYRSKLNILTLQEENLLMIGGTGLDSGEKYIVEDVSPHIPTGLMKKSNLYEGLPLGLEEMKKARDLMKFTLARNGFYFEGGFSRGNLRVFLEPLNEKGETIRDPRPIDDNFGFMTEFQKHLNFPFKRDLVNNIN